MEEIDNRNQEETRRELVTLIRFEENLTVEALILKYENILKYLVKNFGTKISKRFRPSNLLIQNIWFGAAQTPENRLRILKSTCQKNLKFILSICEDLPLDAYQDDLKALKDFVRHSSITKKELLPFDEGCIIPWKGNNSFEKTFLAREIFLQNLVIFTKKFQKFAPASLLGEVQNKLRKTRTKSRLATLADFLIQVRVFVPVEARETEKLIWKGRAHSLFFEKMQRSSVLSFVQKTLEIEEKQS